MFKCKKSLFILIVMLFVSKLAASDVEYIHPFKLNPLNDGIQIGTGVLLAGSGFVCDNFFHIKDSDFDAADLDKSKIPALDQLFMQPYRKPFDYIGTGFEAIALLSPFVFYTVPKTEWMTISVMYAESLMFAYGIKQWGKLLVPKARPYMYFSDYPQKKVDDGDWNCSFPSGHTTLSFTAAAFTSYVFCQYFPESKWRYGVVGISFGVATTTAILRMVSGNHFFTDVMTGAVIGTACGLVVPFLHSTDFYKRFEKKQKEDKVSFALSPLGFEFAYKF